MRHMGLTGWMVLALGACGTTGQDDAVTDDVTPPDTSDQGTDTDLDTDTDTDTTEPEPQRLFEGGVVECADPSLRRDEPFERLELPRVALGDDEYSNLIGSGMALADFDDDGWLDLLVPGGVEVQFYMGGPDGSLVNETVSRLPEGVDLSDAVAASAADYDGDGDLDLLVLRYLLDNVLLANDGTGHFTDVTADAGLDDSAWRSLSSAWGDMDRDGDLDLFVSNYGVKPESAYVDDTALFELGDPSYLYENNGDGTFTNISDRLPPEEHDGHTFMASWVDIDENGYPELATIHDFGWYRPPLLFWNDGGVLTPDLPTPYGSGFDIPFAGMGMAFGDMDGDGLVDFVQSSWKDMSLLLSEDVNGVVKWYEEAPLRGLVPDDEPPAYHIFGWGTAVSDLDLDGDLDTIILHGHWEEWNQDRYLDQTDTVFELQLGQYVEAGEEWGLDDRGAGRGLLVADVNRDGYPDVIKRQLDEGTLVYLSRCGSEEWLRVRLHGDLPNSQAIGAKIEVRTGARTQLRWVDAGSHGMFSGGPPEVLFGLSDDDFVDKLEITWPDGTVDVFDDFAARQAIDVYKTAP